MSADVVRQVSLDVLRDLDMQPRATLRVRWEDLPSNVKFLRDEDDLNTFEAAALRAEPNEGESPQRELSARAYLTTLTFQEASLTFLLLRYRREPDNQLTVLLPGNIEGQDGVDHAIWRVVAALHLRPSMAVSIFPVQPHGHHASHLG